MKNGKNCESERNNVEKVLKMKLEAYGTFIVAKELTTKKGTFVVDDNMKAEIVSVGSQITDLKEGDVVYYIRGSYQQIHNFILLREENILCKVIE